MASEKMKRAITHHVPSDSDVKYIAKLRQAAMAFADILDECVPMGREKALAETHLEETVMWAVKAIVLPPL